VGDLLLKTRLNVTLSNLERVENLPVLLSRRDDRVDNFLALPKQLQEDLDELSKAVDTLRQQADPAQLPPELVELGRGILDLDSTVYNLRAKLAGMTRDAQKLRDEFTALTANKRDLDVFLQQAAGELKETVTADNYWMQRDRCERVFYEYVDLLRGVALRSIGLHDENGRISDLFDLADSLPKLWGTFGEWRWQSLAVPSRIEQNEPTQASVLRIGFPEWTVWALPLLQHECGHVVIEKHKTKLTVAPGLEAVMLADALAGLVTGPAYTCAELLLRLDPSQVSADSYETMRSATILVALEHAAEVVGDAALKELARRLGEEWSDALLSIDKDPELVTAAKSSALVRDTVQLAADFLRLDWGGDNAKPPYWADNWGTIEKWAVALAQDPAGEISTETVDTGNGDRPAALAFLLNAAWRARVPAAVGAEPAQPALDRIATTTVERMLQLIKPSGSEPRKGGRNSRS
jgi:hypothetical protein